MMIPSPLDPRKQGILKAIVTDYVYTAEPVGSHTLMARYAFGVRSATLRNEMAELSELGYLQQPHTSAGRIPSDLGYRFYVDRLMELAHLQAAEADDARRKLATQSSEVELILGQTCRILADMARYTSLATHPVVKESTVKHISVVPVGSRKLLAVMVLDNGAVFHELLQFDPMAGRFDPITASNYLMRKLGGQSLESIDALSSESFADAPPGADELAREVIEFIKRELRAEDEADVHLEGAGYIMRQPEFKDVSRLETVLSILEERSALFKLFSSVYVGPEVTVIIGSENPLDQMRDCSFVGTKYRIGGRIAGTIGLIGPTRMDYRRAVAAVEFMARNLEDLLTQLSEF